MTTVAAKVDPQKSKKVSFKLRSEFTGQGQWCQMAFSQTIKRVMPKPFDLKAWIKKVKVAEFSDQMLDAVEDEVARGRLPIDMERGRAAS